MNAQDPILILQMQRMGDLVLSFPLVGWLKSLYPETPIWILGEKIFYEGLVELSPPVTYFSYSDSPALASRQYSLLINLSHRREAADLAGRLRAAKRVGPYTDEDGSLRVNGAWQLYRSSISHNNRYNLFHWADLNAMDIIPSISVMRTSWPPIKEPLSGPGTGEAPRATTRVGLFVGASEPDKRPEPQFWAELAKKLLQSGAKPVFLGGQTDRALAGAAAGIIKAPAMDLSGKFSIIQLCRFISELDLLIVPDTGPMHIAAWAGSPVLNLSIGPVNPWETGPFAPGHHVLRPALDCTGCWACTQPSVICKEKLRAEQVAVIAGHILERSTGRLAKLDTAAGYIYRTRRDEYGLFDMEALNQPAKFSSLRQNIALYWKLFFGLSFGFIADNAKNAAALAARRDAVFTAGANETSGETPGETLGKTLPEAGQKMLAALSRAIRGRTGGDFKNESFWLSFPTEARPLSSYIQLTLHNDDFSPEAINKALRITESFISSLRRA